MRIKRLSIKIVPSAQRMLLRPFIPGNPFQVEHILFRIFSAGKEKKKDLLEKINQKFSGDGNYLREVFMRHYNHVKHRVPSNAPIDDEMKYIVGAYFTQEYALESTALFNPSIVLHPEQDKEGVIKFILSLRAIGEGHISSIVFREGEINKSINISLKPASSFILEPERLQQSGYEKFLFTKKVKEIGALNEITNNVLEPLNDYFTFEDLEKAIARFLKKNVLRSTIEINETLNAVRMLALSNCTVKFTPSLDISEKAIYPVSPSQSNGLEDARFVRFVEDDGSVKYYSTFTAYDGKTVMPQLLETTDFNEFKISTLNGPGAANKGMALFPRKVNGLYMMLGRQDNESLYLMTSDNPYFWYENTKLITPTYYWEYIQIGNCGSPIEIDEGWLVITHGVGLVRSYSMGAILLHKEEPWRVIGRLEEPLLEPTGEERYGYVPNVLYSCGALVVDRTLVLPYAMSDVITLFATIELADLLGAMINPEQ